MTSSWWPAAKPSGATAVCYKFTSMQKMERKTMDNEKELKQEVTQKKLEIKQIKNKTRHYTKNGKIEAWETDLITGEITWVQNLLLKSTT